ncbi:MAG: glycosyltransferase [Pseudomonadota bacterium]
MQVLHLSADFPDPLAPHKTNAVRGLLGLIEEIDHRVYSLNRVGPAAGIHALSFEDHHRAIAYGAAPYGLLLQAFLSRLSRWIMTDIEDRKLSPVAIHAHKLSIEALVGDKIAGWLGVPLIVSCQGNSDLKILKAKPDLHATWREIWQGADWVLPFAPWTTDTLQTLLGPRTGPMTVLPCPTSADAIIKPETAAPVIRSAFNLDQAANKNARMIVQAAAFAAESRPDLRLEIIGSGAPSAFASLSALIEPYGDCIRLTGPVPHGDIQTLLNDSACFVMPSVRESYGMVFAEALLAGCPVIHGTGNGISGYFPGADFARPARPNGALGLGAQLVDMIDNQAEVKAALAKSQQAGTLDLMRRPAIAERYRKALYAVTEMEPPKPKAAPEPAGPKPKFSKVR